MILSILRRALRKDAVTQPSIPQPPTLQRRLDVFRVSVHVMGKWEQLSSHSNQSEALSKAEELSHIIADTPVRISTRNGRVVRELEGR